MRLQHCADANHRQRDTRGLRVCEPDAVCRLGNQLLHCQQHGTRSACKPLVDSNRWHDAGLHLPAWPAGTPAQVAIPAGRLRARDRRLRHDGLRRQLEPTEPRNRVRTASTAAQPTPARRAAVRLFRPAPTQCSSQRPQQRTVKSFIRCRFRYWSAQPTNSQIALQQRGHAYRAWPPAFAAKFLFGAAQRDERAPFIKTIGPGRSASPAPRVAWDDAGRHRDGSRHSADRARPDP